MAHDGTQPGLTTIDAHFRMVVRKRAISTFFVETKVTRRLDTAAPEGNVLFVGKHSRREIRRFDTRDCLISEQNAVTPFELFLHAAGNCGQVAFCALFSSRAWHRYPFAAGVMLVAL